MNKTGTATLACGLLLGAALTVTPAAAAQHQDGIDWGKCASADLQKAGAQCGTVKAPLDPADPGAGTVSIAVSRIKHTVPDSAYQGVMLVNPGGPGGAGLRMATQGKKVPNGVGKAYDWIGFDPRGVGESTPKLSCDPKETGFNRPDYTPDRPGIEQYWRKHKHDYAKACGRNGGKLLEHMKTTDSVSDMEAIRTALGAEQINFLGFSYGTYLGQVYSTLHPDRMRRMVLDSNVDPRNIWYQANLNQEYAFDRNLGIWFEWLAKHDDVYHLGKTKQAVHAQWYQQRDRLKRAPAGGKIGPAEWTDIFQSAGYYRVVWTELADAFSAWVNKGDAEPLISEFGPTTEPDSENNYAVYNAVQCTDIQWPRSYGKWRADAWRIHATAPFNAWSNTWYNAPCLNWPAKAGKPVQVDGSKTKSALLIGETLDAATPFEGSLEVRSRYPGARLIGEPGGTAHADSLYGNACVDDRIADYLATGKLPDRKPGRQSDVTCAPLPDPQPENAEAQKRTAEEHRSLLPALHF
ncbi:alpha/beta hydrolase [Sciscionella sediminilitoris]|uniref:alpha/beta hydrolase n=1 Tax=Sciscionella sediminilitoris TaxID=1445613 RepID=UPI0004DEF7EC|nr:alpha/beta hydrolase [Sciscionella sp. SE31]